MLVILIIFSSTLLFSCDAFRLPPSFSSPWLLLDLGASGCDCRVAGVPLVVLADVASGRASPCQGEGRVRISSSAYICLHFSLFSFL